MRRRKQPGRRRRPEPPPEIILMVPRCGSGAKPDPGCPIELCGRCDHPVWVAPALLRSVRADGHSPWRAERVCIDCLAADDVAGEIRVVDQEDDHVG